MDGQPLSHRTMEFRKAKDSDIADLLDLTLEFCRQTPMSSLCDVSVEKITEIYLETIVDGKGSCWVSVYKGEIVGFIIGRAGELPFTRDLSGIVICWWVKKDKRFFEISNRLFELFEFDMAVDDVKNVIVAAIGPDYSKSIEKYYAKKNYRPYEMIYIKDIR